MFHSIDILAVVLIFLMLLFAHTIFELYTLPMTFVFDTFFSPFASLFRMIFVSMKLNCSFCRYEYLFLKNEHVSHFGAFGTVTHRKTDRTDQKHFVSHSLVVYEAFNCVSEQKIYASEPQNHRIHPHCTHFGVFAIVVLCVLIIK